MTKHYASGDVNDLGMDPAALSAGFNLADVGDADSLRSLPSGVQGLYYLDKAEGVTSDFVSQMNAIKGDAHLFGVYLADEPDPSTVRADSLRAESDWIHANMPGVKTFIVADNQGSNTDPDFHNYYTQASTHIDLWGLDVYPFRTEVEGGGDVTEVDRTVAAAKSQIGITTSQIVPVFQAFGGGDFPDGDDGKWSLPTPNQEKALMAEWQKLAPNPVFDYAYSWAQQEGDAPLSGDAALIAVFKAHNGGTPVTSPSTPDPIPTDPVPATDDDPSAGDAPTDHHHRHHWNSQAVAAPDAATAHAPHWSPADTFDFNDAEGASQIGLGSGDHAAASAVSVPAHDVAAGGASSHAAHDAVPDPLQGLDQDHAPHTFHDDYLV